MLINDTKIPLKDREVGCKALILHDVLENTTVKLPEWVEDSVRNAVDKLTFDKDENKLKEILTMSSFEKLLLLVDLLSSMYEDQVSKPKRKIWKLLVKLLLSDVRNHYGDIRIIQIGSAIYENTNW